MSKSEWMEFMASGTRTAKLATTGKDGRPHVAPIWFVFDDDGAIIFMTGATTAKGRALQRDNRVALCVDDDAPPFAFVMVQGTVALDDDLDVMLGWSTRIGGRYMGAERAESFGRRNAVPGELLVKVSIDKVVAESGIAD